MKKNILTFFSKNLTIYCQSFIILTKAVYFGKPSGSEPFRTVLHRKKFQNRHTAARRNVICKYPYL